MDLSISLSNRTAKPMSHLLQSVSASTNLELLPLLPADKATASTNPIAMNPHNNNSAASILGLGRRIIDMNQVPSNNCYSADSNGETDDREEGRRKDSNSRFYNYYYGGGGNSKNHDYVSDQTATTTDEANATTTSPAAAAVWRMKRERSRDHEMARSTSGEETTTDQQLQMMNQQQLLMHEVSSRAASFDDDDDGFVGGACTRKKLRLSKDQSALLEDSFKEHSTLNPKQKTALAKQLDLTPRQVEVWFQNRRARTKLKQTEADCELLKKCCETLTQENRRLQKEVQELRAMKAVQLQQQQNASSIAMANNHLHHHPFQILRHNSPASDRHHHGQLPGTHPNPSSNSNSSPHNPNPLCSFCSPPSSDHRHFPTAANYI